MEAFQLWSVLNSGLISNAIYQAGTFFILWVASQILNLLDSFSDIKNTYSSLTRASGKIRSTNLL